MQRESKGQKRRRQKVADNNSKTVILVCKGALAKRVPKFNTLPNEATQRRQLMAIVQSEGCGEQGCIW